MKAIVAERGQVTIPKKIRDNLGILPQTVLEFHEKDGKLIIEKASEKDPVNEVLGCLRTEMDTNAIINELRDVE